MAEIASGLLSAAKAQPASSGPTSNSKTCNQRIIWDPCRQYLCHSGPGPVSGAGQKLRPSALHLQQQQSAPATHAAFQYCLASTPATPVPCRPEPATGAHVVQAAW